MCFVVHSLMVLDVILPQAKKYDDRRIIQKKSIKD